MKIGLVNLNISNIASIKNALEYLSVDYIVLDKKQVFQRCEKYILPGVGSYDEAVKCLEESGLNIFLTNEINVGKSILGICLGMQLLSACSSESITNSKGLNFIPGIVEKLPSTLRTPHVGWNNVSFIKKSSLFQNIPNCQDFYFVHSYHYLPLNKEDTLGITDYGQNFVSVINSGNVYGVQFHPEKSQKNGLQLIKNFVQLC